MKTTNTIAILSLGALLAQGCVSEAGEAGETVSSKKAALTSGGIYQIKGVHSGRCLEIIYGAPDNGANAQIYDCWGGTPQQFGLEDMGGGYFRLRNVASNKCLDVWGWSTSDGGDIRQYDCGTGYNQQFAISDTGGGKYKFINRHSGKALEVAGWGTANGTNVQQWSYGGGDNQLWTMTQVGVTSTSPDTSTSPAVAESKLPSSCFNSQRLEMTSAQLAVAMARELGEINPLRDLYVNGDRIALSAQGLNRCSNGCETVRAILELQDDSVNQTIDQNVFNATVFRTTLVSNHYDQANWEAYHSASLPGAHSLTLVATSEAYCGTDFEFQVNWECTDCNQDELAIENRMARFFRADNPVIDFRAGNGKVTIDPTGALNGDSSASAGGCTDACIKMASSGLDGECCICNGSQGTYVKDGLKLLCR